MEKRMPYYKCRSCHHEFERIPTEGEPELKCDWCHTDKPIVLEIFTPLEKMANNWDEVLAIIEEVNKKTSEQ